MARSEEGKAVDSPVRNSRKSPRLRRRFKVTFLGGSSFTSDVGIGGFSTERARVFPPGIAVEGSILVGGIDYPFRGRVAWAQPGDLGLGIRGRMGVEFVWLPAQLPRLLGFEASPGAMLGAPSA